MSCPWIGNRENKGEEKTLKCGPQRWKLKQQYTEYQVQQYNITMVALGECSKDLSRTMCRMCLEWFVLVSQKTVNHFFHRRKKIVTNVDACVCFFQP